MHIVRSWSSGGIREKLGHRGANGGRLTLCKAFWYREWCLAILHMDLSCWVAENFQFECTVFGDRIARCER